jgi:superfamily II DNA/RNA helicase
MDSGDAEALRRQRKREARRLREAEQAVAQETAVEDAPAETEAERLERKRKRKEAKRRLREAAAAPAEQPVKKSKAGGGASVTGVCAKVGDHEAAAKGAPIKKSFYTECDELAALSTAVRARSRVAPPRRCHRACSVLTVAVRGAQEVASLREELHITVEPAAAVHCKPVRSFEEARFPKNVLASCRCVRRAALSDARAEPGWWHRDFKQPSPIQAQCWPIIMRGTSSEHHARHSHL